MGSTGACWPDPVFDGDGQAPEAIHARLLQNRLALDYPGSPHRERTLTAIPHPAWFSPNAAASDGA